MEMKKKLIQRSRLKRVISRWARTCRTYIKTLIEKRVCCKIELRPIENTGRAFHRTTWNTPVARFVPNNGVCSILFFLLKWLNTRSGWASTCAARPSPYLGGWEERSPVRRGCGAQPLDFFLTILVNFGEQIIGLKRQNSWKSGISG